MLDNIPESALSACLIFIAGTIFGAWINHRFGISRDRRRELNATTDKIAAILRDWRDGIPTIPDDLTLEFERRAGKRRWRRFAKAHSRYQQECQRYWSNRTQDPITGELAYHGSLEPVRLAAAKLEDNCKRK